MPVDLGRVSLVGKGDYSPTAQYERLDVVRYNGAAYLVLKDVKGVTPSAGANYMKLVEDGADGAPGAQGPAGENGTNGTNGSQGPAGPGVPTGGTARQVLKKKSAANYDTEWADSVGQSMTGKTVNPTSITSAVAAEGAEIFNDYRARAYDSNGITCGNIASGEYSHAEGLKATATMKGSHAEGWATKAFDEATHAEGYGTLASGFATHVEGYNNEATGDASHAEGYNTTASGHFSHTEGSQTTAPGSGAHAEGCELGSSSTLVHAGSEASGMASHAEGGGTEASGSFSHAGGYQSQAKGDVSRAAGMYTIANTQGQVAIGSANVISSFIADRFIVGKGTGNSNGSGAATRANCFRVTDTGVWATGQYATSGADYAEMFEWADGNPDKQDRAGLFVTLDGSKIRLAGPEDDYILGIVSGNPSVVGDIHDDQWQGMYLYDVFGRPIWEDVEVGLLGSKETGLSTHIEHRQKLNPDYDSSQTYQPRSKRPEWAAVGLLGKLVAVDDGSCEVNSWCTVSDGGIATKLNSRTKYRVMERLDDTHIRILIL